MIVVIALSTAPIKEPSPITRSMALRAHCLSMVITLSLTSRLTEVIRLVPLQRFISTDSAHTIALFAARPLLDPGEGSVGTAPVYHSYYSEKLAHPYAPHPAHDRLFQPRSFIHQKRTAAGGPGHPVPGLVSLGDHCPRRYARRTRAHDHSGDGRGTFGIGSALSSPAAGASPMTYPMDP